ncbi:MAG: hypothetical protein ACRD1V_08445 [Vicinamibacterales bacterium]
MPKPFGMWHVPFVICFVVLATMNSAGYRYGASDQAFYIPVVLRALDPALFPRDAALIDSQGHLTLFDNVVAGVIKVTGVSIQHLFLGLYLLSLALLVTASLRIARRFYATAWTGLALAAALTLRHEIAKTGANMLEGYFQPRQLAFALGLWAVAAFLDRRDWLWPLLLATAAALHPTTAMWFVVWLAVAAWFGRTRWRPALTAAAAVGAAGVALAIWRGPLEGRLAIMDRDWLAVIADKGYLFPVGWPVSAWITNLVSVPVIVLAWRARARRGLTIDGETPLVLGALALVLVFVVSLPLNAARVALVIQLQIPRVFWMLDVFGTIYLVWWLSEGGAAGPSRTRAAIVTTVVLLCSMARGTYANFVQFRDRPLFAVDVANPDWRDAMAWARSTDVDSGWLADPMHAVKYGSSVRAAGWRDVLLERVKDHALAMYDRSIAMRVADREQALSVLAWDTPSGARALAKRYDLDYLVIDHPLDLPLAHRSGSLFIYKLR